MKVSSFMSGLDGPLFEVETRVLRDRIDFAPGSLCHSCPFSKVDCQYDGDSGNYGPGNYCTTDSFNIVFIPVMKLFEMRLGITDKELS